MHQIGYDMKRCVIVEDRAIGLKSGPLRSSLETSRFISYGWYFLAITNDLSETCEHVQDVTTACDSLRFLETCPLGSHTARYRYDVGVVGTMAVRRKVNIV